MIEIVVHDHALKHGLTEEDVLYAWNNFIRKQRRKVPREDEILVVGFDSNMRAMQIVGCDRGERVIIFHALTPPTEKALRELGLARR